MEWKFRITDFINPDAFFGNHGCLSLHHAPEGSKRDVKTMVDEDREALKKAGKNGPYILMPHSMSALEAIYWSCTYPDEVKAILGLDMAVPDSYNQKGNGISELPFNKTGLRA